MIYSRSYKYISVLLLYVLFLPGVEAQTRDQQLKVALRSIGHEFLLQLDDSTSRILPVKEEGGRYSVKVDRTFSFEPDLLAFAVIKVMEETGAMDSCLVEVEECNTK